MRIEISVKSYPVTISKSNFSNSGKLVPMENCFIAINQLYVEVRNQVSKLNFASEISDSTSDKKTIQKSRKRIHIDDKQFPCDLIAVDFQSCI